MNDFNIIKNSIIFILPLLLLCCMSEPKSEEAQVREAQEEGNIEEPVTNYHLTGSNHISWIGTKPTGRHNGTIRVSQGFLSIRNDSILGGRFSMDLNDIHILDLEKDPVNHKKLVSHLKSSDFFDVESYPMGSFVLTEVKSYSNPKDIDSDNFVQNPNSMVTGNLTLRDSTLSISFPSKVLLKDSSVQVIAKFNIDRTRWGISYRDETKVENKIKDKFIHNKVNIAFDFEIEK